MRDKDLKYKRDQAIKAAYAKLDAITIGEKRPVKKYRHIAILEMLSDKFYLTPDYIQNILCSDDTPPEPEAEPEDPNQMKMFGGE